MKTLNRSTNLPLLITTAFIGALALGWGAASIAADIGEVPRAVVKFGDLNLSNPQGASALYKRISTAAIDVCRPLENRSLASKTRVKTCVHTAIADAVTEVGQPELFAVYDAKNPQHLPIVVAQTR